MNLSPPANIMKRIGITLALGLAFIVMASIFTPDRSQALAPRRPASRARPDAAVVHRPAHELDGAVAVLSADAHAGLHALGTMENGRYTIAIFATDLGPRYTIFDSEARKEVGTLLSIEQLRLLLPEIDLKGLDFSAPADLQPLMLAEPRDR